MIVDCISDLHGHYPKLDGGDLLIVAGDLTARDEEWEYEDFGLWLTSQLYRKKIVVAGNHDNKLIRIKGLFTQTYLLGVSDYLCDSGTEFVLYPKISEMEVGKSYDRPKLKIWGTPWTKTFEGMNPRCKAFTVDTEEELGQKFDLIPDDTDILITHSPPFNILDDVERWDKGCIESVGSTSLRKAIERVKPRLHVFGHIHEHGGKQETYPHHGCAIQCVNASHVNERYWPVNKPVRIIL